MINLVERKVLLAPKRPPIMLTSPVCGDVVAPGGTLAIQGLATVFEAALTVELRDASGTAVFSKNLMTEEGNVESRFSDLAIMPAGLVPGFYDLVAFNLSPKDGSVRERVSGADQGGAWLRMHPAVTNAPGRPEASVTGGRIPRPRVHVSWQQVTARRIARHFLTTSPPTSRPPSAPCAAPTPR